MLVFLGIDASSDRPQEHSPVVSPTMPYPQRKRKNVSTSRKLFSIRFTYINCLSKSIKFFATAQFLTLRDSLNFPSSLGDAYQNVSIILQSFFNVTLRSKNLNWLLSTLLTIIVLSNLVLELNNALMGYVPFCRWTKKYFCWRPCRLCRNDLFSQRLHFALKNETYTTFCSYARFLGYRRFVGSASGT